MGSATLAIVWTPLRRNSQLTEQRGWLPPHGRQVQEQLARLTESGNARGASALLLGDTARPMLSYPGRGLGWLMGGSFKVDDPSDMLTMIAAGRAGAAMETRPLGPFVTVGVSCR